MKDINEFDRRDPSGLTLRSRLKTLAGQAERDIMECANTCDAYSKKKLLSKVLKGAAWESRLTDFLDRFMQTRSEIKMALALHTASNASQIGEITTEMHAQ